VNRPITILALILVLVLTGFGTYWFYQNFSLVEEEVDSGPSPKARENVLLAAERFLAAHSRKVVDQRSLGVLPPATATLIMPGDRFEIGQERAERLLDWVKAGGHLIVKAEWQSPGIAKPQRDWLLAPFGVMLRTAEGVTEPVCQPLDIDLADADNFLRVDLIRNFTLVSRGQQQPFETVGSEYGNHILRYRVGIGVLTILSSHFFENTYISKNDNAALLWHLVRIRPQGEIWMIHSSNMPPLWKWLWQNAWMVVLSSALLFAAWLFTRGQRFGPPIPQPELQRRSLLDHVRASGEFFWRTGNHEKLLQGARDELYRELHRRHPGIVLHNRARLTEYLSALTGYGEEEISRALFRPCHADEFEFTRIIQMLAILRANL